MNLKPTLIGIGAFFVLLTLYTRFAGPIPLTVSSVTTNKTDVFSVTGEGKVSVRPDIAMVSLGVNATGTTVKEVQDRINQAINKTTEAVKALGVDEKDIQTSNYSIHPTYDYRAGTQKITGYTADTDIAVKVRAIDKTGQIIDTATAAGANSVGGVNFGVDNKEKAVNEARSKAAADARKKAATAASTAGFKLGKIVNYSESAGANPIPMRYSLDSAMSKEAAPATQLQTGSSDIEVSVTLSYELE